MINQFLLCLYLDVDECNSDPYCGCSAKETCLNIEGSCECRCSKGFALYNKTNCLGMYYNINFLHDCLKLLQITSSLYTHYVIEWFLYLESLVYHDSSCWPYHKYAFDLRLYKIIFYPVWTGLSGWCIYVCSERQITVCYQLNLWVSW